MPRSPAESRRGCALLLLIGLGMPVLVAAALLLPRRDDSSRRLACEQAATLRTGQFLEEAFERCLSGEEPPSHP